MKDKMKEMPKKQSEKKDMDKMKKMPKSKDKMKKKKVGDCY